MKTKTISSTDAQNNFGRVLDDVVQNSAKYVVQRRNQAQAIVLSLAEFERLLASPEIERMQVGRVIRELTPVYDLGREVK
ncbi:MAG: type II toxin-antitoxin system Phd/YefM family antitoxin [Caldilineaceae bacterium]|jgi:prevent-host-death family protein|uniref:type II toxin-antitoxin system Phd/YefM family antitoxin n=1 Tax=Caldilinea sp. TaxID=2293560 RepID=UPI0019E9A757|nr:type II toxin-antitoxin system Phd/YefM family antitoxin [Caldilineaceae bacterium]MBK8796042.1 type II toxin-antitoxin system Phd/YefM family antitoxin [Anaerolineales bacterium]HQY92260.1 type II toxin-antitoxin system Phd/YefM family antitoxin [Caldilinea sp.]HRA66003.1 type II toxin-antitoxin system Phd/YefM family antitoxin [Caldilinea sp.]